MRRCSLLRAHNVSLGLDAALKVDMLPTYEGRERLYGTHSVLSVLEVYSRHPTALPSPSDGCTFRHPLRRGQPHLFIWRRSSAGDGELCTEGATGGTSAERIEALGKQVSIPITQVPRSTLVQLCGDRRHQNVVLEVGVYEPRRITRFPPNYYHTMGAERNVVLFLDHITDPMNLGNILRTSFFFGVRRVILSSDCCRCTPTVARASVGVLETMAIVQLAKGVSTSDFFADARQVAVADGMRLDLIAATAVSSSLTPPPASSEKAQGATTTTQVLVLGNEDAGLPSCVVEQCTHAVHIPAMCDRSVAVRGLSLNVNSACAVLLSHLSGGSPCVNPLHNGTSS